MDTTVITQWAREDVPNFRVVRGTESKTLLPSHDLENDYNVYILFHTGNAIGGGRGLLRERVILTIERLSKEET